MTDQERDRLAALRAALPVLRPAAAKASLSEFIHLMFPEYDQQPFHRLIVEKLEAVERGEIRRLMLNMPPRRGKSVHSSVYFPAWYLGRSPHKSVIACSHTASLANDFSRKVRRIITDQDNPFGLQVAGDEGAVTQWGIENGGGVYVAAGVGGGITGKGAHLLSVDDPIKNREQAFSKVYRDRVWDWLQFDALTRLAPNGVVILTATRWHDDDPCGRFLRAAEEGGEEWTVLEFPEIAEPGIPDALGREPGEVLWPGRFPLESTRSVRETQPHVWFPLFQQQPTAADGTQFTIDMFDDRCRFKFDELPVFERVCQFVDSAFKDDVSADFSVIATWGATENELWLLDIWRKRVQYPDLLTAIKDQYAKWQAWDAEVFIENKASGQSAIQSLRRSTLIPVQEYEPGQQNKVSRAQDGSRFFRAGRIRIPVQAEWVAEWVAEHLRFPAGDNDDQVDTTSMAMAVLGGSVEAGSPLAAAPWETRKGEAVDDVEAAALVTEPPAPGIVVPTRKTQTWAPLRGPGQNNWGW
jgi:predicted phage terminase large subunit-like protein